VTTLIGTWFDGRTSRGRTALLSQPEPGLLRMDSEGEVRDFAAAQLQISPRLGQMERILQLPELGQVHLADSPLLDAWLPRRDRVEGWAHWLEGKRAAALGAAIATVVGVVLFVQVGLPAMADRVAPIVPRAMEQSIGEQALSILDSTHLRPTRLPKPRQEALQARFATLVADLPRAADYQLGFRHAPGIGPNALALPNGQIIVTDQLVTLAESDDELIAVLAHEAGHHEHRHGMRAALENSAIVVVAGFLFGDVSGTGSLSVSIPILLLQTGFSRDHETEADRFAFARLRQLGISPAHFATAMQRMSDWHGESDADGSGPASYLSTHPPSQSRIDAARVAAEGMPAPEPEPDREARNRKESQ
jgi:Zn-dependent protease with chaperone function